MISLGWQLAACTAAGVHCATVATKTKSPVVLKVKFTVATLPWRFPCSISRIYPEGGTELQSPVRSKMRSQVQVGICLRPLVENEVRQGGKTAVEIVAGHLRFNKSISPTGYDFEYMFGPSSRQTKSVYDTLVRPLVDHFFQGFTATVFAYGQTGSGKTYLMGSSLPSSSLTGEPDQETGTGKVEIDANSGIIPMSLHDIFEKKTQLESEGATVELQMSYLEIYQEECYDLLSAQKGNLKEKNIKGKSLTLEMRENTKGETALDGLSSWPVTNYSEVKRLLAAAAGSRATGKTAMNARSSRSHAIATFSMRITMGSDKIDR